MQFNFVGRNIEVTQALETYTTEKLRPLEKRHSPITNINIVFHIENISHIAEATIHLNGTEIHATAKDNDMYKAIDLLADKLLGQLTKHKEKIINKHRG